MSNEHIAGCFRSGADQVTGPLFVAHARFVAVGAGLVSLLATGFQPPGTGTRGLAWGHGAGTRPRTINNGAGLVRMVMTTIFPRLPSGRPAPGRRSPTWIGPMLGGWEPSRPGAGARLRPWMRAHRKFQKFQN